MNEHVQFRCARTGRLLSLPLSRVERIEETNARADVVMVGGERVPVTESLDRALAALAKVRK